MGLKRGQTCLGRTIYRPDTDRQNWARMSASSLSSLTIWMLGRLHYDEKMLDTAIEALQRNFSNPIHYGDNKPGSVFESGVQVVPDPRFTYFDLWQFGITGEDGYKGFLRDCGLPDSMPHFIVVAAISLLLIDDAIAAIDRDDPWYATWVLYQAHDLFDELRSSETDGEELRKFRKELASLGGKARHAHTEEIKAKVIEEWKTGRFRNNKSRCARWAVKEYPESIKNKVTVTRWILAFESATQQAE